MQTERLDDIAVVFVIVSKLFILVLGIKLAALFELLYVADAKKNILSCHIGHICIFFEDSFYYLFLACTLVHFDNVISHVVNGVYRAAAGVQHDIVSV